MRVFVTFVGLFFFVFGTPLFIRCLVLPDAPKESYFLSALFVAIGLVCLLPTRWFED